MRKRMWFFVAAIVAVYLIAGGAMALAKSTTHHSSETTEVAKSSEKAPETETNEVDKADKPETDAADSADNDHDRKVNHGFYVSKAAHCENVDDPATAKSPDFTAPADCKTNGEAHGKYVSSVAQSSLGKSNHKKK